LTLVNNFCVCMNKDLHKKSLVSLVASNNILGLDQKLKQGQTNEEILNSVDFNEAAEKAIEKKDPQLVAKLYQYHRLIIGKKIYEQDEIAFNLWNLYEAQKLEYTAPQELKNLAFTHTTKKNASYIVGAKLRRHGAQLSMATTLEEACKEGDDAQVKLHLTDIYFRTREQEEIGTKYGHIKKISHQLSKLPNGQTKEGKSAKFYQQEFEYGAAKDLLHAAEIIDLANQRTSFKLNFEHLLAPSFSSGSSNQDFIDAWQESLQNFCNAYQEQFMQKTVEELFLELHDAVSANNRALAVCVMKALQHAYPNTKPIPILDTILVVNGKITTDIMRKTLIKRHPNVYILHDLIETFFGSSEAFSADPLTQRHLVLTSGDLLQKLCLRDAEIALERGQEKRNKETIANLKTSLQQENFMDISLEFQKEL